MRSCVIISDTHFVHGQPFHWAYDLAKEFIKDFQPDMIVHLGDVGDFSYISSFNKLKPKLNEGLRIKGDLEVIEQELTWYADHATRVMILEGNHDERVERYVEAAPMVEGLIEIENLKVLKAREIEWYPLKAQPVKLGDLYLCHGWWAGLYPARKHVKQLSANVVFGHTHRRSYWSEVHWATNREVSGWGLGCLSDAQPEYLRGAPSGWQCGFGVAWFNDDGAFTLDRVPIINDRLSYKGETWKRPKEKKRGKIKH